MQGQIVKIISNLYTVKVGSKLYACRARGKLRLNNQSPLVGDYCVFNATDKYILELLPRKNYLTRPAIANVDIALIVTSLKAPDLALNLLDKQLTVITANNVEPVICFTKKDLLSKKAVKDIKKIKSYYQQLGIKVLFNTNRYQIKKLIKNKIVVLTGQTGAGKSSLVNALDKKLMIKTNEISKALNRGKHTTTHVELYLINHGYIADTPGFSAIDVQYLSNAEIKATFIEFNKYQCPYQDCQHLAEPNCAIKQAVTEHKILVSRYENYCKMIKE